MLFGLMGFLWLNYPVQTRYVTGIAGASQPLATESGTVIQTRAAVEGIVFDLRLPSRLVHPAPGDQICLRADMHRFTRPTS